MSELINVVIVLGRCSRSRELFGIRFEEVSRGQWQGDWAFPIQEQTARREQFDKGHIKGTFGFTPDYPGCPSCHAPGVFRCACEKVACWDREINSVTCPWCRQKGTLGGTVDRLNAGGDA